MQEKQNRQAKSQKNTDPVKAAIGALTLVPGLNAAAWYGLGYPIQVGIAWAVGICAVSALLAFTMCPKGQEGRRDRWGFAKQAFIAVLMGSMVSALALIIIRIAQAL